MGLSVLPIWVHSRSMKPMLNTTLNFLVKPSIESEWKVGTKFNFLVSWEYQTGCTKIHLDRHNSMTSCNVYHFRSYVQTASHEKEHWVHFIKTVTLESTSKSYYDQLLCLLLQRGDTLRIGWARLICVLFYMEFLFIRVIIMLILIFSIFLMAIFRNNDLKIADVLVAFCLSTSVL